MKVNPRIKLYHGSEVEAIWLGWSVYNLIVIGLILEKLHCIVLDTVA